VPNLGVVPRPTGDGTVFADIPGLIAGAHAGIGLGHDFLRHVERTRLLVHLIDATASDPWQDYQTIQQELAAYGQGLDQRPQIVVLNKIDAIEPALIHQIQIELQQRSGVAIYLISAVTQQGLDPFLQKIWDTLAHLTVAGDSSQCQILCP
jgi:GTP-binding protein